MSLQFMKERGQRLQLARFRPKVKQLVVALVRHFHHDQAAIRQRLGPERFVQQHARLPAQRRHGVDSERVAPHAIEVDLASIGRPGSGGDVAVLAVAGEDGPTAAVGLHHGELRQLVYERQKRQQLSVRRKAWLKRLSRSAQHYAGPESPARACGPPAKPRLRRQLTKRPRPATIHGGRLRRFVAGATAGCSGAAERVVDLQGLPPPVL